MSYPRGPIWIKSSTTDDVINEMKKIFSKYGDKIDFCFLKEKDIDFEALSKTFPCLVSGQVECDTIIYNRYIQFLIYREFYSDNIFHTSMYHLQKECYYFPDTPPHHSVTSTDDATLKIKDFFRAYDENKYYNFIKWHPCHIDLNILHTTFPRHIIEECVIQSGYYYVRPKISV